jgi:hypothetical protein
VTLAIDIPEAQLQQLRERAGRLGVPIEELAAAIISAQLSQPDGEFEAAATAVLEKNAELYRRLA